MTEQIIALCRAMVADEGQEELLLPLAQAVRDRLAGRLRPGIMPRDCGPAFALAAAMITMEQLSGLQEGRSVGEVTSFTAGDLTIQKQSGGQTAKSLSEQAEEMLAPWLRDEGFLFRGVAG